MRYWLLTMALLSGSAAALAGSDGCGNSEAAFEKAQSRYAANDRALNVVWKQVRAKLEHEPLRFKDLRDEQRNWIEYRDQMAALDASGGDQSRIEEDFSDCADYQNALAEITQTRTRYLQAWINPDDGDYTGVYSDSFGGDMLIEQTGQSIKFVIDVVRGPTYHVGGLSGDARVTGNAVHFEVESPDGGIAKVAMARDGQLVSLNTENAQGFAGARAYFDARYAKVSRSLSAAQRERLENPDDGM